MIEGELYVLADSPKCVFACKRESRGTIYHYACVNGSDQVKIPGIGLATGTLSRQLTRIANDEERSRFYEYLHESGYHYNMANKKLYELVQENYYEKDYYRSNSIHCVSNYRIMDIIRSGF